MEAIMCWVVVTVLKVSGSDGVGGDKGGGEGNGDKGSGEAITPLPWGLGCSDNREGAEVRLLDEERLVLEERLSR